MSCFLSGGDSSEKLSKEFRRPLSKMSKIEDFSNFSMTEEKVDWLRCFLRKYPNYLESNEPFYLYEPTEQELRLNTEIERKRKEEKEKGKTDKTKKKGKQGNSIVFQGIDEPDPNQPGPSGLQNQHRFETIEDALAAAQAEGQNNLDIDDEDFAILDNQEIGYIGQNEIDQDAPDEEIAEDIVYEFIENNQDNDEIINLLPQLPPRRQRKKPSRFDDYDLN